MYNNLFNLKLNITKLIACSNSLYKANEDYRKYLDNQREDLVRHRRDQGNINLIVYWGIFFIISFANLLAFVPRDAYNVLFWLNLITFISSSTINLVKTHKIENEYDEEWSNNLFSMFHVSTAMLAFLNSLNARYDKMLADLSDEERCEYEAFLQEHQEELDEELAREYDINEVGEIVKNIVTESDNNVSNEDEYQEYEECRNEYLSNITSLMTDYLLEETVTEDQENRGIEEENTLDEDKDAVKRVL